MRIDRQREDRLRLFLSDRKLAFAIAEVFVAPHQMDRPAVLHAAFEAARLDALERRVAIAGRFHHEQMIDVLAVPVLHRQSKSASRKTAPVTLGDVTAALDPAVYPRQLQRQDGGVNLVES